MSWTGRKRTQGDRHPSGKLKRHKPATPPDQPHRKGYGSNPLAETQHGRYFLDGAINDRQYLAGTFFGRSRLRYRAAIGSPNSLRSRSEGPPVQPTWDDADAVAAYLAAREALGRLTVDLEWVIVQDVQLADLTCYRAGLDVLRRLYRV